MELRPGLRLRNATDGLIPLRAGYPTAVLGSVDQYNLPVQLPLAHRHGGPAGLLHGRGLRAAVAAPAHSHPDFLKVRNSVVQTTSISSSIAG